MEVQVGVLSERVVTLTETVERRFDELGSTMRGIQVKQAARDTHCAGESESNAEVRRQLQDLWKSVETNDECKVCKQTARLARLETLIGVQNKIAWIMATSTMGLIIKAAFELLKHAG
jgi:ribosomal protein L37AE/L43A